MTSFYTRSMPDMTTYTKCMPENPKPMKTLVYSQYMQRPFQFNLAISTAKNLACVGHTSWYKNQRIPTKVPNPGVHLAYITTNNPMLTQMGNFCRWDIGWCMVGI